MVLAAAAILFISLILVPRPPATAPVVMLEPAPVDVKEVATIPADVDPAFFKSMDFSGLIPDWTGRLPNASYVDFTSIGRIDLTSLVPEKPVKAVQSIPATIQPIYDYSVDFPVVNQWSIGINYTIGLIQNSLSNSSSSQPATDGDLGSKKTVNMPDIC